MPRLNEVTKYYVLNAGILLLLCAPLNSRGASISLVSHTNTWRYRKGTSAPQTNWKTVADAGLNATWLSGNGGIGYADNTNETSRCATLLTDMRNGYSTVAMRHTFQVTSNIDSNFHLVLTMDWDDGFIAWLDGQYIGSWLSPGAPGEPAFNALATDLHESSRGNSSPEAPRSFDGGAVGTRLGIGPHVLAIVGLNEATNSSDFIQVAQLSAVSAPTNGVSGLIATDTTWQRADSPIIVAGDVTVGLGVTLTIEPGVSVLFSSNTVLTVDGRLLSEGDETNRIVFSRAPGNSGTWQGITVNGGPGSPETRIRHAHIEFNSRTAVNVPGGTVWLDHLTFGTPAHTYIEVDGASFIISDCTFPSATTKFEFVHGSSGIRSDGHGIIRRNFFGLPVGYSDVIDFTGGLRPAPIVHIINNVFSGATDDGVDIDGTDAWVEGNIFQHVHRRGDTPDSAAAVSGGSRSGDTSQITVIGNIFYDCDNPATAKQGNFYTFFNNTIVHTTNEGGIDSDSGVFNLRDTTPSVTTYGRGIYAEGNIIVDASQLVRNYNSTQSVVTLNNNILPAAWTGPGVNNSVTNPLFRHVPTLSETVFTNWAGAQIYREWFALAPGSPAIGTGPNGRDKGAVVPFGVSLAGMPSGATHRTNAVVVVGINRTGSGIPTTSWPAGSGYTHYQFRVDGGAWSAERAIGLPVTLALGAGPHVLEVIGKRDSGLYQNDPVFGEDAVITEAAWVGETLRIAAARVFGGFELQFSTYAAEAYSVQWKSALGTASWSTLTNIAAAPVNGNARVVDGSIAAGGSRFYRVEIR